MLLINETTAVRDHRTAPLIMDREREADVMESARELIEQPLAGPL